MKKEINSWGILEIRKEPISIFDIHRGGNHGDDGCYYVILTHVLREYPAITETYAILREDYNAFLSKGKCLDENEILCINGEKSRPMTDYEENLWNSDSLHDKVDLWGNVKFEEFIVGSKYSTTDWFTGGTHVYECVARTETSVTFKPVYHEQDGTHNLPMETHNIEIDYSYGEYIVLSTYKGEECRLYAFN